MSHNKDVKREQALRQFSELVESADPHKQLITPAQEIAKIIRSFADGLCEDVEFDGLTLSWALRCIIRKTHESLETVIHVAEITSSYYASPLLRSICEELIFIRYLRTLSESDAGYYLGLKTSLEILENIKAQDSFFPKAQEKLLPRKDYEEVREQHGVSNPPKPLHLDEQIKYRKKELKDLGQRLGWGKRISPSVKFMAENTNSLDEYDFFYRATSGSVHANSHHLARMMWGDPVKNSYSISNSNFDQYYFRFVLVYGAWLAVQVTDEIKAHFPDMWPEEEDDVYSIWIAFLLIPNLRKRFPPLVTEEELRSPEA